MKIFIAFGIATIIFCSQPAAAQTDSYIYYCDPVHIAYPYVITCDVPWRKVLSTQVLMPQNESRASGSVKFSFLPAWGQFDCHLPKGKVLVDPNGVTFVTTEDADLPARKTIDASVLASGTGQCGNIPLNSEMAPVGTLSCPGVVAKSARISGGQGEMCQAFSNYSLDPNRALTAGPPEELLIPGRAAGVATFLVNGVAPYTTIIPRGLMILATTQLGEIAFETTKNVILRGGARRVDAPIEALGSGECGNVRAGEIRFVNSGMIIPLSVSNAAPTTGGAGAECAALWH